MVGTPKELAEKYYNEGIDELVYMDIVASLYQRNLDFDQLRETSKNVFIPLTVGGGIRSLGDIEMALHAGADKVAINTYAIHHPEFLREAAEKFGSQCVVLSVEAIETGAGRWEAYTDGGREKTGVDVLQWIEKALTLGVGEILLTSIDRDGTKTGYDLTLLRAVENISTVPVILHGGAASPDDVVEVAVAGAEAVSVSSILHYGTSSVGAIKKRLQEEGIEIRK